MARATGIGGVFFRSPDPVATSAWYRTHLGLDPMRPATEGDPAVMLVAEAGDMTVWAPFPPDTDYFGPTDQHFMVNFRVDDLDGLLASLRAAGVEVDDTVQEEPYGRFGWVVDCDGRRIELWEPAAPPG